MPENDINDLSGEALDAFQQAGNKPNNSLSAEVRELITEELKDRQNFEEDKKRKSQALEEIKGFQKYFVGVTSEEIVAMVREDRDR